MDDSSSVFPLSVGQEDPLEKGMATHSSILAWELHGQWSLAGYNPWGCKESDMTEQLFLFSLLHCLTVAAILAGGKY